MTDVDKQLDSLSAQRRDLFRALLAEKRQSREPELPQMAQLEPDLERRFEPFPLTDMQYAYWLGRHSAFQLGNVATHMYEELEVANLDIERLNRSWQRLIERHDMLRAIILADGRQQILPEVPPYQIDVTDMREQGRDEREAYLQDVRQRMSHQILSPDQWPLFEIRATRLPEAMVRIHVSIDGLLLDGWSYQLLFREWFALYQEPERVLRPLELSFRDYVLAEQAARASDEYQRSLAYWRERLVTLPPAPDLPVAVDPSTLLHPHFIRRQMRLEAETWQALKTQGARAGLTPSGLLLAAYAEVIAIWSRSAHFALNVPRFNRVPLHPQVNELLGEFASFTLLEVDYRESAPFAVRARKLQDQLWRDLDHQQVSGVQMLRELSQIQYKGSAVAMPVVFTSLPHEVESHSASSNLALSEQVVYGITQTSQVWLDYQGSEEAGSLVFNWDGVEELFPAGLLDDMFDAFCGFLRDLAWRDEIWQQEHPQLLPQAQLEVSERVNDTSSPLSDDLLQMGLSRQVALRPQQPAVLSSRRTLTYEELFALTNRLGRYLRQSGSRPDQLVAIVMEKGWEQIVGVLGVLTSGAAYLPIDPTFPAERLAYILKQSAVRIVLTQSWLLERLTWPAQIQPVAVDQMDFSHLSSEPLELCQSPDSLAYVIYTSGSTGFPKGAMITQRAVVNAITYTNERFQVGPQDRVLALTALHHDMSVYDIFGLLSAGGSIVLPPDGPMYPQEWLEILQREQVTIWNSVPALLEMLVEQAVDKGSGITSSLRLAFLGGDWVSPLLVQRAQALAENLLVVSVGGPTETTLWNICYPVAALDPSWKSIPYGKPIANTKYYVLNEQRLDCPVWVPGELCCAGVGLTKGYWGDEAKTQEHFTIHPRTGERLYCTGDLGRRLPDGTIEFLGRKDFQVKMHGLRIELGEIEAVLSQHPLVRSAVVTATETNQGKRLVAHLVLEQGTLPSTTEPADFFTEITAQQSETLLLDKTDRIQFKLNQRGLRSSLPDQEVIPCGTRSADQAELEKYSRRRSYRKFLADPLPFERLSNLLRNLSQVEIPGLPIPKYLYPSGGGLYPVQTYLYVKEGKIEGLRGGTYYYHPREHSLVLLSAGAVIDPDIHIATNQPIFQESSFSLFLVAQMAAIEPMYGSLAREFCLLEAGYMGQLLMGAAPNNQIGLCPAGSVAFTEIRSLFLLEDTHILLHTLFGGGIAGEQTTVPAYLAEITSTASSLAGNEQGDVSQVSATLRAYLSEKLPEYMLPSLFRVVEQLPLTANGKVDRKALSAPDLIQNQSPSRPYAPPTTDLERVLADIWAEVLQVERPGIHDNFVELGGNSLHIVQMHQKLQQALQREIIIVELFQYPTIAALAEALSLVREAEPPAFQSSVTRADARRGSRQRIRSSSREKKGEGSNLERLS